MEEHFRRRVPHYATRTVTHSAPEFANHEQDIIRQCFSTGNKTWMKEALPVELAPDSINLLRRQRMERNRLAEPVPQTWSKMSQLWGGGCYQEFEYIPDEYERRQEYDKGLRQGANEQRDKISNHDWRYATQETRMKHESMINDPRKKETYPYLGGDKDAELLQSKLWMRGAGNTGSSSGSGAAAGSAMAPQPDNPSFLAGRGRGLEDGSRSSRMTLPTIVQRIQRRLDSDWEDATVVVSATDQDLIQIAFHMDTVDSERGVMAYMNVLSKDVDLVGALGLRKVSQLWGMRRDFSTQAVPAERTDPSSLEHTWMFFLLMPKWVRMRPTDAYYTVHPRSQGSAFRMSTAGSSVLLSLGSSVLEQADAAGASQADSRSQRSGGTTSRSTQPSRNVPAGAPPPAHKIDLDLAMEAVSALPVIKEGRGGR